MVRVLECCPRESTDKQLIFLNKAAQYAERSTLNQRHGCVVVINDEIISTGWNHNYMCSCQVCSIHAEMDALRKIKRNVDLTCAEMYVVRIGPPSKGSPLKLSKPCESCTRGIIHRNLGKVFYSWSFVPERNPRNRNNYTWHDLWNF